MPEETGKSDERLPEQDANLTAPDLAMHGDPVVTIATWQWSEWRDAENRDPLSSDVADALMDVFVRERTAVHIKILSREFFVPFVKDVGVREGLSRVGAVLDKRHRDWIRLRMLEYSMETCCFRSFLDESGM